jgi:GxxExxY protein
MAIDDNHQLTGAVIGAAITVHRQLGPGLNEIAYEEALSEELSRLHIANQRQVPLPLTYKGVRLDCGYRLDILVEHILPLELKAVVEVLLLHEAQTLTYQKIGRYPLALLMNFHVSMLKDGIMRMAEDRVWTPPDRPASDLNQDLRFDATSQVVVDAAIEVHRHLGPGLLRSSYITCLCYELSLRAVPFEVKKQVPVTFNGAPLSVSAEIPLLVAGTTPVYPVMAESLGPLHTATVLSCLRQGGWNQGLILNFNSSRMSGGIKRVVA